MSTVRQAGDAVREESAARGLEENRVVGEYTHGEQIEDRDDTFMPRFLYAFWRLCQQQIASVDTTEVNHSALVIADRAGVSPDVRVTVSAAPASPETARTRAGIGTIAGLSECTKSDNGIPACNNIR